MANLFLYLNIFLGISFHAGHLAEYQYSLDNGYVNLKFKIEKAELHNFGIENCNFEEMTAICTVKYLSKNAKIILNNLEIPLNLKDSYVQKGHLIVNLISDSTSIDSIKTVKLYNNCFYEFNPKFKNRVILDIGKIQKSYLLNKNKTEIQFHFPF